MRTDVFGRLDLHGWRAVASLIAAVVCLTSWRFERAQPSKRAIWPPFWLVSGAVFVALAVGRALDGGALLGDLARNEAAERGWYGARRPAQAAIVGVIGAGWMATVAAVVLRVPERLRRYLPMMLIVVTLGAFTAIRLVSLHHVDAVLHRREFAGVRVGTWLEYALVSAACAVAWWSARRDHDDHRSVT